MVYDKLVSAITNDVYGGLKGYHSNMSLNPKLLADDINDERLQIIKEYQLKGVLPINDLAVSLNCIPVDCKDITKCEICEWDTPQAHFEIPLILSDYGIDAILYAGSVDKSLPFLVYTSTYQFSLYHKYRRRKMTRPYIWIDITPNENGMNDCWVFNAPLLKVISVVGIFKDLRQAEKMDCCNPDLFENFTWINNEIKKRLTLKKIQFYRLLSPPNLPNTQQYT